MSRARRIAAFGTACLLLLTLAGAAWLWPRTQPASPGSEVTLPFTVERGRSVSQVARSLQTAGLVRDGRVVVLLAKLRGWEGHIQAGEYELSSGMTPLEILAHIMSGRARTYTAVLPEGIRASEIALRLEQTGLARADAFMAVVEDPEFTRSLGIEADSLEGYLYPETYEIPRDLEPSALAELLVDQFEREWSKIEADAAGHALTRHEIVTLASIVEKETAAPEERPLIAGVFLNRMKRGMRLETDPTVIYGIEDFDGNLRRRDLQDKKNPYNTYQISGLPPGPIASPGADAMRAVLEPAETDYLYFVSRNDGTHHFSRSYREHVNAVNRYQKSPQRIKKSPQRIQKSPQRIKKSQKRRASR